MNSRFAFLLLFAATLLMSGCGEGNLASKKPAKTSVAETAAESDALQEKTEARHTARFTHQFPDGGSGGVTSVPVADQPFYGFHGENYSSSTGSEGIFTEVNFQFRLLDHRDGKDIYEIIRTVYRKSEQDGSGTSETVDLPKTFDVEYAGEELTVFDDEFGIAKLVPRTPGGEDSAQAMGTWGTLGPMGPADCPAEAVSLARALNRSRGAWRFKGTLTDGENVSTIDTKFEIVGGSPRRNWSFNAPIRYKDDPWFSATLVLGKPVQSPDEVVYVLAIHHFPESERHIKRLPNTVLDGEWDLESRTMRWFEVKNRQVINEAGSMVMQDNGAIQFELELYGGAGDVLLSGTLTNRLADVKSAQ